MTQLNLFANDEPYTPHIPFADCRVSAACVTDFVLRYYRGDRLQGIERDIPGYVATIMAYHAQFFADHGYCFLSRHESVTGQAVAWPPL